MGRFCGIVPLLLALAAVVGGAEVASPADNASDVGRVGDPLEECDNIAAAAVEGAEDCVDENKGCIAWSEAGECESNPGYMLVSCRRSCKVCEHHEYEDNDFGEPQLVSSGIASSVKDVIAESVEYMQKVNADPEFDLVRKECRNEEKHCSEWAIGQGCDDNPTYMKLHCAPACQSCDHVLDLKKKCSLDPNGTDAVEKGGMDALFERMVKVAATSNWEPTVLSRPPKKAKVSGDGRYTPKSLWTVGYEALATAACWGVSYLSMPCEVGVTNPWKEVAISGDGSVPCEEDVTNPCNAEEGPWVITLENFIAPEEKAALLRWGAEIGYERSQAGDAIIEARTSSHTWCEGDCSDDPVVIGLHDRIAHVTGIPVENSEYLQLLKYSEGQYYQPHNDFIDNHAEQAHGPRLLTFFIYFNEVEEGGGTWFPYHNLTVEPREGRVLIWPSVLDEDPYKEDKRMEHAAIPVEKGQKFAANAWIHMRNFKDPFHAGCPS